MPRLCRRAAFRTLRKSLEHHESRAAMLIAMKSKVAKWVFFVLMGFVTIALVISLGPGDLFLSKSQRAPAITVGDTDIYRPDVEREFTSLIDQMSQVFGTSVDVEQARAMGLMDSAVRNIVTRTLFDKYTTDLKLDASEAMIGARLAAQPGLVGADGRLDPARLDALLRSTGMDFEGLIVAIRQEIVRDQLYSPIAEGATIPTPVVELIYAYRNERRIADTILIAADALPAPAAPDEAALTAYHDANSSLYMAPEYRSIDYVWFTPDTFVGDILLDDAQLREGFETRKVEFDQPELRHVEQIYFPDEATATAAAERIRNGEVFDAVAQELTGTGPIDMGEMEMTGIVSDLSILVETAFATPVGEAGGPVETPLGWHIVRVTEITPAHTPTFEDVRDLLAEEMRRNIAVDRMIETANLIDDELAAGASLAQAADVAGVSLVSVEAIDMNGLRPDGTPVVDADPTGLVAGLAFQTEPGETSLLTEDADGNGYAIVAVKGSTPPEVRLLDEVRDEVAAAWLATERMRLAGEKAAEIAAAINAGQSPADIATAEGLVIATSKPVTRSEGDGVANLPAAVTGTLFTLQPGQAASGSVPTGHVVAVLKEVQPADPAGDAEGFEDLATRMQTDVATDLLNSMANSLRERYPVEIDQTMLEQDF